jgi:glycosyltransferase involved in cell wall biosynthesis
MKVSIFSTFYPFRGGIAQFSALLFRSLEKKHTVKAFTFKRQYPNFLFPGETQYVTENDQVDQIPSEQILDSINPITYLNAAKKINAYQSDIYISNYWMTFFGPSLGVISRFLNKNTKQIAIIHNMIPHEKRFFDKPFNRFYLKRIDGFVVMSDIVLKDLLSLKPEAKFIQLNHPTYNHFGDSVDQQTAIQKLKIADKKHTLLFFGFIREYKGLDLLIDAMAMLDDRYQLIIAGEVYGSFDAYQEQINNSSARERIHLFNKYISDEEVPVYFSAADVCVLPYKSATQSGITAISNHFNLPVIATDVGGLKESIEDQQNGLIVKDVSVEALKNSIEHYFSNNLKEKFTKTLKERNLTENGNSWDNFTEKLMSFAESI